MINARVTLAELGITSGFRFLDRDTGWDRAEVFRGGFQAIPDGQAEAGRALGLGNWQILALIVLPQVFRHALPATINMVVIIIGVFDLLASASAA